MSRTWRLTAQCWEATRSLMLSAGDRNSGIKQETEPTSEVSRTEIERWRRDKGRKQEV